MAVSSLDDRMLGEKVDYYCSSSEDEDNSQNDIEEASLSNSKSNGITFKQNDAYQTGPKGVIEDLRQFKKLESEKSELRKVEYEKLIKKYAMTCENQDDSLNDEMNSDDDKELLDSMEDRQFMALYNKKRMAELQKQFTKTIPSSSFGTVLELDESNYIEAIDDEKPFVTVVIHIYKNNTKACEALNGCLQVLAEQYESVKFCKIEASVANLSTIFRSIGTPAILVYRNKNVIGNFVSLSETLGDDFYATDVEAFLNSYDLLPKV